MENQTPTVVIEQQGEKRRRGGLVWLLALAFVAVLAIGGTFAYLTYTTNQAANRITTDPVLTADLLEPNWDAAAKTAAAVTDTDKQTKDASGNYFIPADASNMLPGSSVAKDPTIVNTSNGGAKMFAGMMLQFQVWDDSNDAKKYVNMTAQQVADTLAIYNLSTTENSTTAGLTLGNKWTQITDAAYGTETTAQQADARGNTAKVTVSTGTETGGTGDSGCMYFYYSDALDAQSSKITTDTDTVDGIDAKAKTSALFSYVNFMKAATQGQIDEFNNSVIKSKSAFPNQTSYNATTGWRIIVKGAGIQSVDSNTAAGYVSKADGVQWLTLLDPDTVNTTYNDTAVDGGTASTYVGTGKRDGQFTPTWSKYKAS